MLGLSALGAVHTALALVAVACGVAMTVRFSRIGTDLALGRTYVVSTGLACLLALGIHAHGVFGPPHVLALITLVVLGMCQVAGAHRETSRRARLAEAIGYTATLLFHLIPAAIETMTRLPAGQPLFTGPDDPGLKPVLALLFLAFLLTAGFQFQHLRRAPVSAPPA